MYHPRNPAELTPLAQRLASRGILGVGDVYTVAELARLNTLMNPLFAARTREDRAYVRPDDMVAADIFHLVLSRKMKNLLLSIVPDPVLYHLHAYEIAANRAQSHVFSEQPSGWHRDPDSEFFADDPTHVSVFVYLSEVAKDDGPFEFVPQRPAESIRPDSPAVSMTGHTGMSFVWHRSYYHRAAPNRGPRRRRLIKISIQSNSFHSLHLRQPFFQRAIAKIPAGDDEVDVLLGRYQGQVAPKLAPSLPLRFFDMPASATVNLRPDAIERMQQLERRQRGEPVAYD